MKVELRQARPQELPVLRRLMQLYLYDFAAIDDWAIGDDGLYGNAATIESFWIDPRMTSFLVRVDSALAGFVLVRDRATPVRQVPGQVGGHAAHAQPRSPGVLATGHRKLHWRPLRGAAAPRRQGRDAALRQRAPLMFHRVAMIVTRMSVGYSGGVNGDARVLRVVDRSRLRDHEVPRRREAVRRRRHVTGRRTPVGYARPNSPVNDVAPRARAPLRAQLGRSRGAGPRTTRACQGVEGVGGCTGGGESCIRGRGGAFRIVSSSSGVDFRFSSVSLAASSAVPITRGVISSTNSVFSIFRSVKPT